MKKWLLTPLITLSLTQAAMAFDGPPGGGAERGGEGGKMRPPPHTRMLKQMDANKDGTITKEEANAFHQKRFDEIDANKDGKLTKDEVENFRPPHPPEGKPPEGERE